MKRYFRYGMRILFLMLIISSLNISCGSDDDASNEDVNPCTLDPFPGLAGVTQSGFQITVFNNDQQRGYLIKATIRNNNSSTVSGEPSFVLRINGGIMTYAALTNCTNIAANTSCEFEQFFTITPQEGEIDQSPEFLCFYYLRI